MIPNWLSFVDIGFLVVVLMFAWGGSQKGFAAQLPPLLTSFIAMLSLFFAYPALFAYFSRIFRNLEEAYLMWLLLLTFLVLGIAVFMLLNKLIAGVLKIEISARADKGWGFGLGFLRGFITAVVGMILLVMMDRTGTICQKFSSKSQVGKVVCYQLVPRVQPRLLSLYEDKIGDWKAELLKREDAGDVGEF